MDNTESFNHITDAIGKTNDALSAYDALTERCAIAQETATALTDDVAAIRANSAGLDAKARGAKFTAANSALALAKGDLESLQNSIAAQKTLAVGLGKATASRLFEVRDVLRIQRTTNVIGWLTKQFDWSQLPVVTPAALAAHHESVREIANWGVTNLSYELTHTDDFSIQALRRLGEHWNELKQLVEAEGVELSIAAVEAPAVAKPKPATVGNVLGTLVAAAA